MLSKNTIEVQGSKIAYLDEGNRTHEPVLLLHGFPESSLLWKDIIPTIVSSGYRAIAPDLPGFGESDRLQHDAHTWENYIHFVTSFLECMQLEKTHLMLHDWGGLIGLGWARINLDRVLSLIVTDTVYSADYQWHSTGEKLRDLQLGEIAIEKMSDKVTWMSTMKHLIPGIEPEVLNDFYRVYETTESRKVALELYRSGNLNTLANHKGELVRLKKPATIIWGEEDPFVSKEFAYKLQQEELPEASVYTLPGAGHFIHIQAPEAVNEIVKNHFIISEVAAAVEKVFKNQ